MQQAQYFEPQQYSKTDFAFFELLKSISELHECESTLSELDIEQLAVGARVLNSLIARHKNRSGKKYRIKEGAF